MVKTKDIKSDDMPKKLRPALSPKAREDQMISLAMDCAEQQMLAGTASSQVITHYLKLGSELTKLEMKKIECEIELSKAKREALASSDHLEELYRGAMNAMRGYKGDEEDD